MHIRRALIPAAAVLTAAALVSSCGSDSTGATKDPTSSAPDQASAVALKDGWVKAARTGMTAAFGALTNDSDQEVTIASATSDITGSMELHETVETSDGSMAMQPKKGGFVLAPHGTHTLEPGGDHLMIMDLNQALKPGQTVTITLTMADGSTTDVTATVKRFSGADEHYQNGDPGDDGGDMDMNDMDMGDG